MGFMSRMTGEPDEEDNFCDMTWENRLYAFGACFLVGVFLSIFGTIELWLGAYSAFAILYTLGTITALAGSLFLRGPVTQFKKMFDKERLVATIVLACAIVATIIFGAVLKIGILALISCIVQFLAFTWYTISFIPYARTAVKSCFSSVTGVECPC